MIIVGYFHILLLIADRTKKIAPPPEDQKGMAEACQSQDRPPTSAESPLSPEATSQPHNESS